MIYLILVGVVVFLALPFLSRRLSTIPYFPSNKKDLPLIIKTLKLRDNQTVVDLGAGTGDVVFAAAQFAKQQKLNTKFVAVEINPVLVFIMYIKRTFHPNRKKIQIVHADMFTFNYSQFSILNSQLSIFIYISPWFLYKVFQKLKSDLGSFSLVSYYYPLPKVRFSIRLKGIHDIYRYEIKESTINNQDTITKKQTNSKS